jgi:ABC-type nitrate/sulfonate/bicarbonate transport system substrate-binding protein
MEIIMHLWFTRFVYLVLIALAAGCGREQPVSTPAATQLKAVKIVIDWQPSAEYYGFFFAKSTGRYAAAGYDVEIVYGKGAPAVAAEVGTGSAMIGTTTSDNLTRWVAKGGSFSGARALITYNPAVVVSLARSNIRQVGELKGKTLGTNPESSVYSQFLRAVQQPSVQAFGIKEDPTISWSGVAQLQNRQVDAILAYTTNVVIDLMLAGEQVNEIFLGDYGVKSYGLVLIATGQEYLAKGGLKDADIRQIFDVTAKAYADASEAQHMETTIAAIRAADSQLKASKLAAAIAKIRDLNSRVHYPLGAVDEWVEGDGVLRGAREKALALYR